MPSSSAAVPSSPPCHPIIVKPTAFSSSASFAGAAGSEASSRHVFTLGVLHGYRLLCLYRFKIWWMIPRFGNSASDVPLETQLLLLEGTKESALDNEQMETSASEDTFYVLFLPVLDGDFRASLQGNDANELQFCIESGDPDVWTSEVSEAVLINSSDNPFELTRDSIRILAKTMLKLLRGIRAFRFILGITSSYLPSPSLTLRSLMARSVSLFGESRCEPF